MNGPRDWPWSSAGAHLAGKDDGLVRVAPLLDRVANWREFLAAALDDEDRAAIRAHERTGHPLGDKTFYARLNSKLGRDVQPRRPGRPTQRNS